MIAAKGTAEARGLVDRGVTYDARLTSPVWHDLQGRGLNRIAGGDAGPDSGLVSETGTGPNSGTNPPSAPADAGPPPTTSGNPSPSEDQSAADRATLDAGLGGPASQSAAAPVTFTITWHADFGADLSANVRVDGSHDKKIYTEIARGGSVDDEPEGGKAAERLAPVVVSVPRYRYYRVVITPLNAPPNDRYKRTVVSPFEVLAASNAVSIDQELVYNRENAKNVDDTWDWRQIDPKKASLVSGPVLLFGRPVRVHIYVIPRILRTNALFNTLSAAVQSDIKRSIYSLGNYNRRTTTRGRFSNHSVGVAFDINANSKTKQDDHFFERNMPLLDYVVQPIVRSDPRFAQFDIRDDTGIRQLEASHVFNEQFPIYIATVLGEMQALTDLAHYSSQLARPTGTNQAEVSRLRDQTVREIASLSKRFDRLRTATKDRALKRQFKLIRANWRILFTWVLGADVKDRFTGETKRAVGMIPMHSRMLEIMLAAGWSWGGDWKTQKDYMHFEDPNAQEMLKRDEPRGKRRRR